MQRAFLLLVAVLMIGFAVASCGEDDGSDPSSEGTATVEIVNLTHLNIAYRAYSKYESGVSGPCNPRGDVAFSGTLGIDEEVTREVAPGSINMFWRAGDQTCASDTYWRTLEAGETYRFSFQR